MTKADYGLLAKLVTRGDAIVYTRRGSVERGPRYDWKDGYSASTKDGGVIYPWLTKRECQAEAKRWGKKAVFVDYA